MSTVTAASFVKGQRVRWLSGGEYRSGTVAKTGRKWVYVAADSGARLQLYPWTLQDASGGAR